MRRQERVGLHKKQERPSIQNGIPAVQELIEGVPAFRNTPEGLVQYVRHGNRMYKNVLQDTSGEKSVKPDRVADKSFGIIAQINGGSEESRVRTVSFSSYILASSEYKYEIVFRAPSSGNVLIEGQIAQVATVTDSFFYYQWSVNQPSSDYSCMRNAVDDVSEDSTVHPKQIVTGLIHGKKYVYNLWARKSGGNLVLRWGGQKCQRLITVTALP